MSFLDAFLRAPAPDVAVELAGHRVAAVAIERRAGGPVITVHATEPLQPGALVPSLGGTNIVDRAAVSSALGRVLERVGRPRRVALSVPDAIGRVSVVRFEKVPAKAQELDQLVRWQVKKAAPFPIEEAQVSYVPGLQAGDGRDFLVTLARRDVIREYEDLCASAGAHAGLVDLATIGVANTVLAPGAPVGDWLLLRTAPDAATIVIGRGEHPIFFRTRAADGDDLLGELVHQTAMYYEDRLSGAGFGHVWLAGVTRDGAGMDSMRRAVQERLHRPVEAVDTARAAAFSDRLTVSPAVSDAVAPLLGILLRDEAVAKGVATKVGQA